MITALNEFSGDLSPVHSLMFTLPSAEKRAYIFVCVLIEYHEKPLHEIQITKMCYKAQAAVAWCLLCSAFSMAFFVQVHRLERAA